MHAPTHVFLLVEHLQAVLQLLEALLLRRADGLLVITQDSHVPVSPVVESHLQPSTAVK